MVIVDSLESNPMFLLYIFFCKLASFCIHTDSPRHKSTQHVPSFCVIFCYT